ncbi:DUF3592 domain-containing protein [Chloroflexus sp.]|uniref:DUF3592 domain-containing protein n=1 Tax=Chloroflexus sp. TaxID=1904827 RepID=UPI00298F0837|nr:DUF3592 domain-containing protein [Chloroflexus sp.]MDW8403256.1 DUF3592 domain-containing protein [Chloroflexus sp.]
MDLNALLSVVLCLILPLSFFIFSLVFFIYESRVLFNDIETQGIVIGFEGDPDDSDSASVIRFVTQTGREVTIKGLRNYTIGQSVTVRYPPNQPEAGKVKNEAMEGCISVSIIQIFCIISIILIWIHYLYTETMRQGG